jgi:hypothetical protein
MLLRLELYWRRLKVGLLSSDRIFECLWSLRASLYKKKSSKANRWCIKFYWCITGSLNWFNKQIKPQLWSTSYVLSLSCSCIDSAVSWRCLTIVQLRQTCCIPLSLELGSRTIDSRSQRSNQRLQANMLIGFDIETPSTFVLRFSLSDFVFCSGLKTQH